MSATPDEARFNELLSRYLDASLGDAEEYELLQYLSNAALASRFYEATRLSTEIGGILAGSVRDEVMVDLVLTDLFAAESSPQGERLNPWPTGRAGVVKGRKNRRRRLLAFSLAATAVLVLAVFAPYFSPTPSKSISLNAPVIAASDKVTSVRGTVYFVGPTGRVPLTGDRVLTAGGTIETVGSDSRATVILRDKTQIELKGDTTFTADVEQSKRRLFLQRGMFVANVTKQPEGDPMIFTTGRAKATGRGTQLAMVEDPSGTYLIVAEGRVALQRIAGGPEVMIEAGFYGHVELEGVFHPFPMDRLPRAIWDQLPEN